MLRPSFKWLSAALVAVAALPGAASAGTVIQVSEVGGSYSQNFTLATLPASFSTGNFDNVKITINSSSGTAAAINSLTTTVNARPGTAFDSNIQLQVIVTDDGFLSSLTGGPSEVQNNASASSAVAGGTNTLTNTTGVLTTALSPLGSTASASDTRPGGGVSPTTTTNITDTPSAFAIQQTILLRATPNLGSTIDPQSTLGGSASSLILTSAAPVPAPPAVLLALAALPALGLRRVLARRK